MKAAKTLPTSAIAALLLLAMVASAQQFLITTASKNAQGQPVIRHQAGSAYYYILYRGTNVANIVSAVDMALGVPLEGQLLDAAPPPVAAFYRVLRVPTAAPLDTDGDGIDDVWELRFRLPGAALNPADANQDHNSSGTPDLVDYWNSLPLVAWFTNAESSALSYGGPVNVPIRFTKPVTGVFAYEIGGNATAGKDYQSLSGTVSLNNSLCTTIPVQVLPSSSLTGPRSIVLTLKTPASNVVSRIPATPAEGNPSWSRYSSHVITVRDADQGFYTGNLSFLSETTRTVANGQTNVTIVPSPAVAPSTLRMALRSAPNPQAVIELSECILFTNRFSMPLILAGNLQGFHSPSPVSGVTIFPQLNSRQVAWRFEFTSLTFTNQGALLDAECRITLSGLTASGIPRILKGTISASRIDP
jgi:hypothetical protein